MTRILSVFLLAYLVANTPYAAREAREAREARFEENALLLPATLHSSTYANHSSRFGGHHALVFEGGSMASKAFLRTPIADREIARLLADRGLEAAGGVHRRAWDGRHDPGDPAADQRAEGTPLGVSVRWEGSRGWHPLGDLLGDRSGRGLDLRFADNRRWIRLYGSGCVICLSSCPGSKIANRTYTVRENQAGTMDFTPRGDLPRDGTPVEVRIDPHPGP